MAYGYTTVNDSLGNISADLVEDNVDPLFTYQERVAVAVVILIIFVIGTLGNSIVILAVLLSKELQNITNVFVVSLAIADLCYCLLLPLSNAAALLSVDGWPWDSKALCWLSALMAFTSGGASLYNLACIALNRLLLIRGPAAAYQWLFTPKKIAFMVVSTWVIPMATMLIPLAFGIGDLGYDRVYHTCSDIDTHHKSAQYKHIYFLGMYPIPLVTIIVCYSVLFLHVRHHFKRKRESFKATHEMASGDQEDATKEVESRFRKRTNKQQMQITLNLFMVFMAFVICSAPYSVGMLIIRQGRPVLFLSVLFTANSSVNPILYTVHHPKFNVVIRCILSCRLRDISKPSRLLLMVRPTFVAVQHQ